MTRPQVGDIIQFGEYGTAQAQHVLNPYTIGTENGIVTGSITDNGIKTITPSTADQTLEGFYASGSKVVGDANFVASNIPLGYSFFGINGSKTTILVTAGDTYTFKSYQTSGYADIIPLTADEWYEKTDCRGIFKNVEGTVRVTFRLKSGTSGNIVQAQIYINDDPVGQIWQTSSTSVKTCQEDFEIHPNDILKLYYRSVGGKHKLSVGYYFITTLQDLNTGYGD